MVLVAIVVGGQTLTAGATTTATTSCHNTAAGIAAALQQPEKKIKIVNRQLLHPQCHPHTPT
jgi:succinyl-CoA synthetase beta subunit